MGFFKKLFGKNKKYKIQKLVDKIKPPKFPCIECLVLPAGCSELCEKVEMDDDTLRGFVNKHKCCPDCGSEEFYEGPCGGMCQNMKCCKCGHKFNFGLPIVFHRI